MIAGSCPECVFGLESWKESGRNAMYLPWSRVRCQLDGHEPHSGSKRPCYSFSPSRAADSLYRPAAIGPYSCVQGNVTWHPRGLSRRQSRHVPSNKGMGEDL